MKKLIAFLFVIVGLIILLAGRSSEPDKQTVEEAKTETLDEKIEKLDDDLAALVPDFVDASTMPWLEGVWGTLSHEAFLPGCSAKDGLGFIQLIASDYVFEAVSEPEPSKAGTGKFTEKTMGAATLSKAEDGYFSLTPPKWEDAYLRLKPVSRDLLDAILYEFVPAETEWKPTQTFQIKRCQ